MSHKLGICIPYRNRLEHLELLVPHLSNHLNELGIDHGFYVGHQVDDKLFNRGSMKNIAAKFAFEDGCDYVAFHDVDMLPNKDCDYSYPEETPIHIATKLSKYNYGLGYDQYFGGVVLFTKEQAEKVNGYSNEYWDWGQEDDDLFWRCYFEGYTTGKVIKTLKNKDVGIFNGEDSFLTFPTNREISSSLHNDHTITILFKAEQQNNKTPIWLVGDPNNKFVEYPLIRKDGSWTWGISFNNSRAVTMVLFDRNNVHHYNWAKRFEGMWTEVTLSYNKDEKNAYFYINGVLLSQIDGVKQNSPFPIQHSLRSHDSIRPFLVGVCNHMNTFYKGKIGGIKIFNRFFENIKDIENNTENVVFDYDFSPTLKNNSDDLVVGNKNIMFVKEDVDIIENILPFRKEGGFHCLPHIDEGFVGGKWVKGEPTAKNEKRLVTEMQQKKIDYKNDGLNTLKYKLKTVSLEYNNKLKMINVTL